MWVHTTAIANSVQMISEANSVSPKSICFNQRRRKVAKYTIMHSMFTESVCSEIYVFAENGAQSVTRCAPTQFPMADPPESNNNIKENVHGIRLENETAVRTTLKNWMNATPLRVRGDL